MKAVYKITHTESGRLYVGSSNNYRKRWAGHRCALKANRHHSFLLQRAWNKHGLTAFAFEVLELVSAADLGERELYWIKALRPIYNRTLTVNQHCLGRKNGPPSEQTKQKIRERVTGFRHTEATKVEMSALKKGLRLIISPAQSAKRREQLTFARAFRYTPERRRAISEFMRQREHTEASRRARSLALIDKPWSEARRLAEATKRPPAHKGKPWSDARRAAYEARKNSL